MYSKRILFVIFISCALLAQSLDLKAQQPTQKPDDADVIRIKTDLVQLRAVVTDRKGQLVDNLKADDFEVLENGRPQKVSFFSLERILNAGTPNAVQVTPGAPEGQPSTTKPRPVRTIVLFVDTLHLSALSLLRAKQQLKQFVDQWVTDQDLVAVVTTSDSLGILQQFLRDKRMLKYAIDKIPLFAQSSSFFTPYLAAKVRNEDAEALSVATQIMTHEEYAGTMAPPPGVVRGRAKQILGEETIRRRATLQMLRAVSERMSDTPGQRMIALMSDGFTLLDEGASEHDDFVAATSKAARSGVVIYSFSPQGLSVPTEYTAMAPIGGIGFSTYMSDGRLDQQDTLRNIAADTGGQAYLNSNDIPGQFKKMIDSNSLYYAFAYYPEDTSGKKFRNLTVRVKNHADFKVRTQKGYMPAKESASEVATTPQEKLFKAMISPLPLTAIGITTSASFLERVDDDAQVTVQIHIDGHAVQYQHENQKYLLNCEANVVIFDKTGKVATSFAEPVTASLTQEQMEKGKLNGYRYNKRLKLLPGLYQIRLGIRDLNSDLMGTSTAWVTVPDLQNNKLTLSGIFLGKAANSDQTAQRSSAIALVAGQPSFKSGEPIFYRLVLYNAPADSLAMANLKVRVEVLQSEKAVYVGEWEPLNQRIVRTDKNRIELGGQMKMGVAPGIYTLRLTVKDTKANHTATQVIDLELE